MNLNLMKHGRKWLALALGVGFPSLVLALSFYLALRERLTSEWSSLCQVLVASVAAAVAAFIAGNAWNTGKTIEATGAPPPKGEA